MKKRLTGGRVAAYIALCVVPIIIMFFEVLLLVRGFIVNSSNIIALVAIPVCAMALFALIVFFVERQWVQVILVVIVALILMPVFNFAMILSEFEQLHYYTREDVAVKYDEVLEDFDLMPSLSEIGDATSVEYYDYFCQAFIFEGESDVLICGYTEEEYAKQKALLDEKYVFQLTSIKKHDEVCEPMAELDGYVFRMLSTDAYIGSIYFPKRLIIIGTNDSTREIVYIAYFNFDLDYISSFSDHILNDCGWKHIR